MADNLIPEPQIQATNIPTGGGAQVRFDFVAPDNTFANLSKTIASASQTMVNFNQLEENERKAQEAFQENLEQIHGLTKTGQLSQADYMKIQRDANAKAQKEGIIRGNENWSLMSAVDTQRAKIRSNAIEQKMLKEGAVDRMSNPNSNIATTFEQEEQRMLEEMSGESLGTDSQGNEVYLDLDDMTPMEMVAYAQARSAAQAAAEIAVSDNKHNRAVEGASNLFASEMTEVINALRENQGSTDLFAVIQNEAMLVERMNKLIEDRHSWGDEGINAELLDVVKSFTQEASDMTSVINPDGLAHANKILDLMTKGVKVNGQLAYAEGTKAYNNLQSARDSMESSYNQRVKAWNNSLPDREKEFALDYQNWFNEMAVANPALFQDPHQRKQWLLKWRQEAAKRGVEMKAADISYMEGFMSEQFDYIPDPQAVAGWDREFGTTFPMLAGDYEALENSLWNIKDSMSGTEYRTRLTALRDQRESSISEEQSKQNAAWKLVSDNESNYIGSYNSEKVNKRLVQILDVITDDEGGSGRFGGGSSSQKFLANPETLTSISQVQRQLVNIASNGGRVSMQQEDLLKRLTDAGITQYDQNLQAALRTLARGVSFGTGSGDGFNPTQIDMNNVAYRNDQAYAYLEARMILEAHILNKNKKEKVKADEFIF